MWVIKLGGSVTQHRSLTQWLQLVARWGDGQVIVVPGGGLYADAVRDFQAMRASMPEGQLSEAQAHVLAIYAMDQMARSFVAMVPELVLVRNPLEIAERGWQHRGLVWLPSEMALHPAIWSDMPLASDWQTTSDSLAAWLARQLDANQLLLVKSDVRVLQTQASVFSLPALQADGIVDGGMSALLTDADFNTWVMHHSLSEQFAQGFMQSRLSGLLRLR